MLVDKSHFLLMAGALAAGGVGGWAIRDRDANVTREAAPRIPIAKTIEAPPLGPMQVTIVEETSEPAPVCDDNQGVPEECPSVGPSDEGICANLVLRRCQEFKVAFKPRLATLAVACLRALKPNERCDPARINQCGHAALMSACPEAAPAWKGQLVRTSGTDPGTVTIKRDSMAPVSPVASACESILKGCGSQAPSPTLDDCRQTLTGLNDAGRAMMTECVSAHCTDRGLYGCEAVPKAAGSAVVAVGR